MWKKILRFRTLVVLSILVFYCVILIRNLNEGARRSLQLRDDTDSTDHVVISVLVTGVNPSTQELTTQISFRPQGALAQDAVTPAVDLSLLTNSVRSQQEFDFPKGKRMNRIEAVFPLNGDLNRYPLDHYRTTLWLLMTTPARKILPRTATPPENTETPENDEDKAHPGHLAVGATTLQQSTTVPLTIAMSASTPGIKFEGSVSRENSLKVAGIELKIRRADNVITVSVLLMTLMGGLAMSLLGMVLKATTHGPKIDLLPLSISISLIFGLPALRDVQPGVPPVGAFGDYVCFIWAEIIVGLSAIIIIWTWLLRPKEHA